MKIFKYSSILNPKKIHWILSLSFLLCLTFEGGFLVHSIQNIQYAVNNRSHMVNYATISMNDDISYSFSEDFYTQLQNINQSVPSQNVLPINQNFQCDGI